MVTSAVQRFGAIMVLQCFELCINMKELALPHQQKENVGCTEGYSISLDKLIPLN